MQITFFGSSHGVPEPNRRCSSTLIEVGGKNYIIDLGTNAVELLVSRGVPVESIDTIFITHMHGDHSNGLLPFVDLCNWYYKTAQPNICLPTPMDKTVDAIRCWLGANGCKMRDFKFHEITDGFVWDDGNLNLTAIQTKHTAASFAFLVEAEGKRILFTADLSHKGPEDDFPVRVFDEPLDLAICESAHFPATKYLPIFKGQENLRAVCITHYVPANIGSIYELKKELDIPVTMSNDGMTIIL